MGEEFDGILLDWSFYIKNWAFLVVFDCLIVFGQSGHRMLKFRSSLARAGLTVPGISWSLLIILAPLVFFCSCLSQYCFRSFWLILESDMIRFSRIRLLVNCFIT